MVKKVIETECTYGRLKILDRIVQENLNKSLTKEDSMILTAMLEFGEWNEHLDRERA